MAHWEPVQGFEQRNDPKWFIFDRITLVAMLGIDVGSKDGSRKTLSGGY